MFRVQIFSDGVWKEVSRMVAPRAGACGVQWLGYFVSIGGGTNSIYRSVFLFISQLILHLCPYKSLKQLNRAEFARHFKKKLFLERFILEWNEVPYLRIGQNLHWKYKNLY